MRDKRKVANALTQDLEFYMFDMKTGPSMMYYRMSMIDATLEPLQGRSHESGWLTKRSKIQHIVHSPYASRTAIAVAIVAGHDFSFVQKLLKLQ